MEYVTESAKEAVVAIEKCESKTVIILDAILPKFASVADCKTVKNIIVLSVSESMPAVKKIIFNIRQKKQSCKKAILFDSMIKNGMEYVRTIYKKDYPAVIVHSGGTTGVPKGVVLSNDNLNYIAWIFKNHKNDTQRGDTWLCAIPLFHAFGLAMGVIFPLSQGMQLPLVVKYNDQELVRLFVKTKPNHIMGSGAHIPSIQANKKIQKMDLSFFKTCGLGGTPLSIEKENELVAFLQSRGSSAKASIGYGMSETCSAIATELNRYYGKAGSAGIILSKSNVKVLDTDIGKELSYGEIGELCFSGPGLMQEYYKSSAETSTAVFYDDFGTKWIHSGDLGYVDEDGFIFITGRIKRIYSTRSEKNGTLFKIFPDYVASVISELESIKESVVVCIDDPDYKSVAIAFVVVNESTNVANIDRLIKQQIEERMPTYCVPKKVFVIDAIPLTPVGKIDYRALEKQAEEMSKE